MRWIEEQKHYSHSYSTVYRIDNAMEGNGGKKKEKKLNFNGLNCWMYAIKYAGNIISYLPAHSVLRRRVDKLGSLNAFIDPFCIFIYASS